MSGCWRRDGEALLLSVRLTSRAAKEAVGGPWTDEKQAVWLGVSVTAVPEKGKANVALVKMLAKRLGVPPASISLVAGEASRLKRLRITGDAAALEPRMRLLVDGQ